jgi:hypothetical protein
MRWGVERVCCFAQRTQVGHRATSEKCQRRKTPHRCAKRKAARRRLLNSILMIVDQAMRNAGPFCFR